MATSEKGGKSMSKKLEGGCYCGRVRYEITGEAEATYFCHCKQCRQITGSAHASNMMLKPDQITWIKGEEWVTHYDCESARFFSNGFCKKCGSGLPFMSKSKQWMFVPIGGIDALPDDAIRYNIFWEDRANWYDNGVEAKSCPGFPPEAS